MLTSPLLKQQTFVKLMIGVALVILPGVIWVDYQKGLYFAAAVELTAVVTLIVMAFLIRPLGEVRTGRITLVIMFALAVLGSLQKLESTPNFAWFSVMPFLYISVGGLKLGGVLTASHFVLIAAFYFFFGRAVVDALDVGTWVQVGLAYLTACALAVSYDYVQRQLHDRLRAQADHDSLTGLLNRRGMESRLNELSDFLQRHDVPVTLALLDVDNFKRVNDQYGHDVGDTTLKEISSEMQRVCRSSDFIARWGGDEFLLALAHSNTDEATLVLERLRLGIAALDSFPARTITLSMGAAEWQRGGPLASALKLADDALYKAKSGGRDRLVAVPLGEKAA